MTQQTNNEEYNGWKNRSTWNVALWIQNDEGLYNMAKDYVQEREGKKTTYSGFIKHYGMQEEKTPDGIKWLSNRLDYAELNGMIKEL